LVSSTGALLDCVTFCALSIGRLRTVGLPIGQRKRDSGPCPWLRLFCPNSADFQTRRRAWKKETAETAIGPGIPWRKVALEPSLFFCLPGEGGMIIRRAFLILDRSEDC
jgi:hypothetical protein